MADETGVPPDNGRNIEVTRMSVGTSEVKDMHVDLLEAVNSSIGAQTERIESLSQEELDQVKKNAKGIEGAIDRLRGINEELIAVMRSQVGGEEGAAGSGLVAAELKTHQKSLGIVNRAADKEITLIELKKDLIELIRAESRVMKASLIEGLIEAGRSLISFRTAMDETRKRFQKTMEASRSGIADIPDLFLDDFRKAFTFGLGEASDSLMGTFELIQGSLQQNLVSPMVLVGGNINEVAREFSSLRSDMEDAGLDLYRNLGFEGQNEVFAQLLDAQLRGDRMTNIRDDGVRHQMGEQISALRLISENTGLSLDELVKANGSALKTLAELQATGAITAEQKTNLTAAMVDVQANAPELAQMLTSALEARGSQAMFETRNADLAGGLRKLGLHDVFQKLTAVKDMGPVEAREAMVSIGHEISGAMNKLGSDNVAVTALLGDSVYSELTKITTGVNAMKELDENRGKQSVVVRQWNKFQDFMENKWPIVGLVSAISAQGVFTLLQINALRKNTAALNRRTALGGGAGGKGGKGKAGGLAKIGSFAGKALKATGALATVGMVGKDLYDATQGDDSNENTGALIGTAIGGLLGTLIPIPGVGTMMGMAIGAGVGNFAGEAIGGLLPSTAKGASPKAASIAAPQLTQMAGSGSSVSQTAVVSNMAMQTRILENIATSMYTSIAVQRDIRDRIGFGSDGGNGGPRDSTKKANNIALIPGRLGS